MNSQKFAILVVITALIACGGVYAVNSLNINNPNTQLTPESVDNSNTNEATVVESIEGVTAIQDQKIKAINGKEIELENGNKFVISETGTIECLVGDIITGYDEATSKFTCVGENTENQSGTTRYITQPPIYRNNLLTDILLYRYFAGNNFLRNNGYSQSFTNDNGVRTSNFTNSNGSVYTKKPGEKATTSKSSTTSSDTNSSKSTASTSSKGHGGGFGGSGSGSS